MVVCSVSPASVGRKENRNGSFAPMVACTVSHTPVSREDKHHSDPPVSMIASTACRDCSLSLSLSLRSLAIFTPFHFPLCSLPLVRLWLKLPSSGADDLEMRRWFLNMFVNYEKKGRGSKNTESWNCIFAVITMTWRYDGAVGMYTHWLRNSFTPRPHCPRQKPVDWILVGPQSRSALFNEEESNPRFVDCPVSLITILGIQSGTLHCIVG